jgi:hypothetical protein
MFPSTSENIGYSVKLENGDIEKKEINIHKA